MNDQDLKAFYGTLFDHLNKIGRAHIISRFPEIIGREEFSIKLLFGKQSMEVYSEGRSKTHISVRGGTESHHYMRSELITINDALDFLMESLRDIVDSGDFCLCDKIEEIFFSRSS